MSEQSKKAPATRLEKFRAMAAEAEDAARSAKTDQMRQEYENLVRAWEQLIREMQSLEAQTPPPSDRPARSSRHSADK